QQSPFQSQQPQSPFQFNIQQPQLPQQQPQSQQQLFLFTNDKAPASYGTKWADLHPDSQKCLLQVEEKIMEYRDESQRLDQCSRLYDSSIGTNGFELSASSMVQELGGIGIAMERQKVTLKELVSVIRDMLRHTELAVRSFVMLRPRFIHQNKLAAGSPTKPSQQLLVTQTSSSPPAANSIVPILDFYSGLPKKPSPFLQQTVARFDKDLSECRQRVEELEQLLVLESENSYGRSSSLFQSLPKVMTNVHDFFVHVAAKVESIHQYIESMKTAYLADQRGRGDCNDPFLEADRRETAKQEAAARRIHPTLHLPAVSQPTGQAVGSLAIGSPSVVPTATNVSAPGSAMSASGSSLFSTPIASMTQPLFSTPLTGASSLGTAATQSSSPFNTTLLKSAFGSSTPLFGSTPAAGASALTASFGTVGAAAGSGSSFGSLSKARSKSRTGRR
ncbi:hypothetical protein M569_04692, partial [Genlisea aurea]